MNIFNADSIVKLKELEENSIDSIVCDPPYFIGFMNRKWDAKKHIASHPDFWEECLRVLKPGGYCLAFGHSRTHHRLFTAIEDAGFLIKDTIMWMYGSGFPKSHNISIALDKKLAGMKHRSKRFDIAGNRRSGENVEAPKPTTKHEPMSDEAKEWEGWGTALKPAYEPVCLAQKPRDGTYADNVLKHGVGGLNIDETRVGSNEDFSHVKPRTMMTNQGSVAKTKREGGEHNHEAATSLQVAKEKLQNLGRFPANIILSHHPDCKLVGETQETFQSSFAGTKGGVYNTPWSPSGWQSGEHTEEIKTINPVYICVEGCPCKELDEQTPNAGGGHWSKSKIKGYGKFGGGTETYEGVGRKDGKGGASKFFKKTEGSKSGGFWKPSTGKPAGPTYNDGGGPSRYFKQIGVNQKAETIVAHHAPKGSFAGGEPDRGSDKNYYESKGRFPANVILSHHEDCKRVGVIEEKVAKNIDFKDENQSDAGWGTKKCITEDQIIVSPVYECVDGCSIKELDEQRGASRFFYCAKAGKKDRNKYMPEDAPLKSAESRSATAAGIYAEKGFNPPRRNHHPTVKPLKLMNYLIKLITPPGGTVLDPFMGSGSTGVAAIEGGWNFVGIEKDKEYYEIAKARLNNAEEKIV